MGRTAYTPLLASKRRFKQHGQSGLWISDWYPEIATCADDLAVIRSCWADGLNHVGSVCQMNTGSVLGGRPCLGSWTLYGLGSASQNLPGYIVLLDYPEDPPGGARNWSTGFMPATYQGTRFRDGQTPVLHLQPSLSEDGAVQRTKLDFVQELNRRHHAERGEDHDLDARIAAYELAYRMQAAAPEAVDLARETEETRRLYGLDEKTTERMGRNCLLARRLVERGVRFVQIYSGSGSKWDAHSNVEGNHGRYCRESDKPIAGLLKDLKRRGLLDSTLVVWGGEFGRTPMSESGNGRDHNPYGFTVWMAGGGVKGGVVHGTTDDIGLYAVENKVHVHDLHATILHCLGLNHRKLTLLHNGRDERPTINGGRVVEAILKNA
jgi:arylsulfatase A-like enzyme